MSMPRGNAEVMNAIMTIQVTKYKYQFVGHGLFHLLLKLPMQLRLIHLRGVMYIEVPIG